jgi:HSP20 family molecular chaperone IbpA
MAPPRRRSPLAAGGIARAMADRARAAGVPSAEPFSPELIATRLRDVYDHFATAFAGALDGGANQAPADAVSHSFELPLGPDGKSGRAVFGYTVRVGLDGLRAEPFGDSPPVRKAPAGSAAPAGAAARAPITDVFEEEGAIRVIAELPGVTADAVRCAVQGQTLRIETTGRPGFAKSVDLPAPVDPASLTQTCRNGILDVRLTKAAGA